MQTLTLEGIKRAARRAYRSRLLTAQHPVQEKRQCVYEQGKYHCAIGCALTQKTLKAVHANEHNGITSFDSIVDSDYADFEGDDDDKRRASNIQTVHDDWATASRCSGGKDATTVEAREAFLKLIGL